MPRPNYFIGIRLNSPGFYTVMATIQSLLVQKYPALSRCLVSLEKLHLTCFVMTLSSTEEIQSACDVFDSSRSFIANKISALTSKELSFSKIDVFPSKVIFTSPDEGDAMVALREIVLHLKQKFLEHPLLSRGMDSHSHSEWTPHVTIAKTSADKRNGRKLKIGQQHAAYFSIDRAEVLDQLARERVPLSVIDLLSMQGEAADKYYLSVRCINLLDGYEERSLDHPPPVERDSFGQDDAEQLLSSSVGVGDGYKTARNAESNKT